MLVRVCAAEKHDPIPVFVDVKAADDVEVGWLHPSQRGHTLRRESRDDFVVILSVRRLQPSCRVSSRLFFEANAVLLARRDFQKVRILQRASVSPNQHAVVVFTDKDAALDADEARTILAELCRSSSSEAMEDVVEPTETLDVADVFGGVEGQVRDMEGSSLTVLLRCGGGFAAVFLGRR